MVRGVTEGQTNVSLSSGGPENAAHTVALGFALLGISYSFSPASILIHLWPSCVSPQRASPSLTVTRTHFLPTTGLLTALAGTHGKSRNGVIDEIRVFDDEKFGDSQHLLHPEEDFWGGTWDEMFAAHPMLGSSQEMSTEI
ncbi:hypothetical protein DPEC_G00161400 [Dallia pectoralis]|uniref:Uncharacterized protein n=1 Tax=Dallia pectoralis TaxID=75939 RepID=A0ACC2GGU6_DALPE|nr:hypothetical protein DPEC_G00161400 [Dallia pectoralis]